MKRENPPKPLVPNSKVGCNDPVCMEDLPQVPSPTPHTTNRSPPLLPAPLSMSELGRVAWPLFHLIARNYPIQPAPRDEAEIDRFIRCFGHFYPCRICRPGFLKVITQFNILEDGSKGRDNLAIWLCKVHNQVNADIGAKTYPCVLSHLFDNL